MTPINSCRFVALVLAIGVAAIVPSPVFAQASGNWTSTGALNTPRSGHTSTLLLDGQVLVAGGQSSNGTIVATAELYNPNTGEWTLTGSMANARTDHTATLLPTGEVLVAGGIGVGDPQSPCTATAELYNPLTGQWRNTGSMTAARFWHGATSLQSGQVLVAGGDICWGFSGGSSPGKSAELYDPSAGTWKATGSMHNNRAAALTLLEDGRALIADETAEFYEPSTGEWTLTATDVLHLWHQPTCYHAPQER